MAQPYQLHQKLTRQKPLITSTSSFNILQDKPFWIWDKQEHLRLAIDTNQQCCFNHIVGLPIKDNKEYPLFDYEKLLYDSLLGVDGSFKDKHLWTKKATGLGVTEFMLRIMAWLCTVDNGMVVSNGNSQMCIVTGPNIEIAIKLIRRLKNIFERKLGLTFSDKESVLELNGCRIEAFPSNHLDAYRSLTNPKFIFIDEADMFRKHEQEDVRHVSERYIGKSDPYIVMVSTPNNPGGLFYQIEQEPEESCLYKRLKLDYQYGLGKIYTEEEIEKAKQSPGFDKEYGLQYLGKIGNVFSSLVIDRAIELGNQYQESETEISQHTVKSVGVDFGFGSSQTAIVMTEYLPEQEKIRVVFAEQYEHANPADIVNLCFSLHAKYQNTWFFVDGANRGSVIQMKVAFGESTNYEKFTQPLSPEVCKVIPVNFAKEHKTMLSHLYSLINKEYLAIPAKYDKLIISLRTAQATELSLDKENTSYDDMLEALRLSLKCYRMK